MLPWFEQGQFPLYLAPMAGVTDLAFRTLCKELGADVMVTEFVSSEGILQRDDRTRKYTTFTDEQRPVGIQLFGADPERMALAAQKVIEWKRPDFIDLNFGCPVNKVVGKNGGSSLLKDCPVLASVAATVVRAVAPLPVTAKIRIGWDAQTINAPTVCQSLEDAGVAAIAIHGRTRAQGYRGCADWEVIDQCARTITLPVIGNGDLQSAGDILRRKESTAISGVMIGRAAMTNPWIFRETKAALTTGQIPPPADIEERWAHIRRHATLAVASDRYGDERHSMQAMRTKLMAYSKGIPQGKKLRLQFSQISSLAELDHIAREYLSTRCLSAA